MTFESSQEIGFDEVYRRFEEQYADPNYCTRNFTDELLKSIDSDSRRKAWVLARIHGRDLGNIQLPWHRSKVDATQYDVVPKSGMLLSEVMGELNSRVKNNAPLFVQDLTKWVGKPLGNIFLSEFVPELLDPTYSEMRPRAGYPVCLDGVHRLIALGQSGLPDHEFAVVVAIGTAAA